MTFKQKLANVKGPITIKLVERATRIANAKQTITTGTERLQPAAFYLDYPSRGGSK